MTSSLHMLRNLAAAAGFAAIAGCAGMADTGGAAPKAYVGNFKDDTVSAIDTAARKVVATIAVPPGPHGMALTPDGRVLFVSSDGASSISMIDTATDRLSQNIEVGKAPHGLSVAPDGRSVLVAVYGDDNVAFVDTATRQVSARAPVGKPHNIAIHPDGRTAYVASQVPGKFALAVIDMGTRAVVRSVPLEKTPRALEFSPDGKALYFTLAGESAVMVLDPASERVVARIAVGASPHYANFTRNNRWGLTVSQGPGELAVFSPASNTVAATIGVGKAPHWVAASGDGRTAYITNEGSNDVSIVDLAARTVTTVPVGNAPRKIAVQQGRAEASASAGASGVAAVKIENFAFSPASIEVAAGQSVTWLNADGAPHAVAVKDGAASPLLANGERYTRVFDKAGTYDYVCSVHPYMAAKVVVK